MAIAIQLPEYTTYPVSMEIEKRKELLGQAIRTHRAEQGLSLRTLALMIGTDHTHLWEIEAGNINVGIELLCKIADGLGVEVNELIDF